MERTEEKISELEDIQQKLYIPKNRGNQRKEKEQSTRHQWSCNKRPNICVVGVPEGRKKEALLKKC